MRLFDTRSGRILNEYSYHRRGDTFDNINGVYPSENNSVVKTSTNTPIHDESKNNDDDHKAHEPLKARYHIIW